MEEYSPEFSNPLDERDSAYSEVALWFFARPTERVATGRQIFRALSDESKKFVAGFAHAPDEHPAANFLEDAQRHGVVVKNEKTGYFELGKFGEQLVDRHFEQLEP